MIVTEQEIVLMLSGIVCVGVTLVNWLARRTMKRRELDDSVNDFTRLLGGGK